MTPDTPDHPACRQCCRSTRVDGTPCRRRAYIRVLIGHPVQPSHAPADTRVPNGAEPVRQ